MTRHCVLCSLSSLLPGITKALWAILDTPAWCCLRAISFGAHMAKLGITRRPGDFTRPWDKSEVRTKAMVRKSGSQPPGQSRAHLHHQHRCSFRSCFQKPVQQSGQDWRQSHPGTVGKAKRGKIKFPSCACYRGGGEMVWICENVWV